MMKKENKQDDVFETLRDTAEKLLSGGSKTLVTPGPGKKQIKELLHELEVYQVELEMQNDELRMSQERLEQERIKFSNLFNFSPAAYFILNRSGTIAECNDTALLMLKMGRSQVIDKRFTGFIIPEDAEIFYNLVQKLQSTEIPQNCQVKLLTLKRELTHVRMEAKMLKDPVSGLLFFYIAVIDISEKIKSELRQREIQDRLQMALTAASMGTWNIQLPSKKVSLDEFAARIFGINTYGFNGQYGALIQYIHPDDYTLFNDAMQKAIAGNTDLHLVFRTLTHDKVLRYVETKGHVSTKGNGEKFFAGILMDITEKRELEEEAFLLKTNQQKNLIKAVLQTEEKERVRISAAIHDSIGQMLYAISLNLAKSKAKDEATKTAAKLLDQVIKDTRNISFELAPSILADFGLPVALKEMIRRVSMSDLDFSIKLTGLNQRMQLNSETFIFRITQELVNNVIKHAKASKCHIEVTRKKSTVTLKVSDNGVGFPAREKPHNSSGLYSIKNRLALYNGNLTVDSEKGAGTTITASLFDII